jgi:2-iminobutanoate/2-iminopropanoate deaminase
MNRKKSLVQREEIHTDGAPPALGPYAQAVRFGSLLFLSGQTPLRPDGSLVEGDIAEQSRQVFANLKNVLEAAGSSLDHVLKATCFLQDLNDFAEFNEVYATVFTNNKPARSTVEVARLPLDANVEVELIAFIPEQTGN